MKIKLSISDTFTSSAIDCTKDLIVKGIELFSSPSSKKINQVSRENFYKPQESGPKLQGRAIPIAGSAILLIFIARVIYIVVMQMARPLSRIKRYLSEVDSLDKQLKESAKEYEGMEEMLQNLIPSRTEEWSAKLTVPTNFPKEMSKEEVERTKLLYERYSVIPTIQNPQSLFDKIEIITQEASAYADNLKDYLVTKRLQKLASTNANILPLSEEEMIRDFSDLFEGNVKDDKLKEIFVKGLKYSDLSPSVSANFRDLLREILAHMKEERDAEKVSTCLIQLAETNEHCWSRKLAEAYNINSFLSENAPATTIQAIHDLASAYRERIVHSIGKVIADNDSHVHNRIIKVLSEYGIETTPASVLEDPSENLPLYQEVVKTFVRVNSASYLVAEFSQLLRSDYKSAALSFLKENILDIWATIFEEKTGHPSKERGGSNFTEMYQKWLQQHIYLENPSKGEIYTSQAITWLLEHAEILIPEEKVKTTIKDRLGRVLDIKTNLLGIDSGVNSLKKGRLMLRKDKLMLRKLEQKLADCWQDFQHVSTKFNTLLRPV